MTEVQQLLEKLPSGAPRVSRYVDFLEITKQKDSGDAFVAWVQTYAVLAMPPAGKS